MQITASWNTGKGKTQFDRGYPNFVWARNSMEASEWPHSFESRPTRPISKIEAREARPGATREPWFRSRRGQFQTKQKAISI
jgi:hypothetical protein